MSNVLKKHEFEYLQAFNIFIRQKEQEIRNMVDCINEKNGSQGQAKKIAYLEQTLTKLRKTNLDLKKREEL